MFYAFKHQQHRLYRLLMLRFEKVSGNSTDETDETLYNGVLLSPQQLPMLSLPRPVRLTGFFLGATSGIFSMMISALGFSGSSPQ